MPFFLNWTEQTIWVLIKRHQNYGCQFATCLSHCANSNDLPVDKFYCSTHKNLMNTLIFVCICFFSIVYKTHVINVQHDSMNTHKTTFYWTVYTQMHIRSITLYSKQPGNQIGIWTFIQLVHFRCDVLNAQPKNQINKHCYDFKAVRITLYVSVIFRLKHGARNLG